MGCWSNAGHPLALYSGGKGTLREKCLAQDRSIRSQAHWPWGHRAFTAKVLLEKSGWYLQKFESVKKFQGTRQNLLFSWSFKIECKRKTTNKSLKLSNNYWILFNIAWRFDQSRCTYRQAQIIAYEMTRLSNLLYSSYVLTWMSSI